MKRFLLYTFFAFVLASCGNSSDSSETTTDTTSPASGATGMGTDTTGGDTTGLNVGAVQPTDGNTPMRDTTDVPGADRSGVKYKINGDTTNQ